jgi:hypothetical protein
MDMNQPLVSGGWEPRQVELQEPPLIAPSSAWDISAQKCDVFIAGMMGGTPPSPRPKDPLVCGYTLHSSMAMW